MGLAKPPRTRDRTFPVETAQLPMTPRCDFCQRQFPILAGQTASSVLTKHYNEEHPGGLAGG